MLLSAEKVMETYASHRAVLELEYFGEVGTGLGPTLEFYTLLSHELQRKGLAMWRSDTGKNSEAAAAQGNQRALFNPKTPILVQKRRPYTGNLTTKTTWDNLNASVHCGDVIGLARHYI